MTRSPDPSPPSRTDFGRVSVFLGEKSGKFPDANLMIVQGTDTRAAIDAPLVANRIGADFDEAELVIMSHVHEDHMAGLRRVPKAQVFVHEADLAAARSWDGLAAAFGLSAADRPAMLTRLERDFCYAPRPDAVGYTDGDSWDLGQVTVRAFHMPGHTAGHAVLVAEPEGVAFIGDIDLSSFGPYYGDASSSLGDFRRTLAQLPEIPAKVWVTGHHRGIYTDRNRFLEDLAAYAARFDERDRRLLDLLRNGPMTLAELVEQRLLYPPRMQDAWIIGVETRTIRQHLAELTAAGRVHRNDDGAYSLG